MNDCFFTSDTHFGHGGMIRFGGRPFETVDEMNEVLINNWNAKVPKNGIVFHLGDFAFLNKGRLLAILERLHGTIRLILGNHDQAIKGEAVTKRFEWIKHYYEGKTNDGNKVVICHYPIASWNKAHYGSWMLHGHCHGSLKGGETWRRLDVGSDTSYQLVDGSWTQKYTPYSFDEIANIMSQRGFAAVDHHDPMTRLEANDNDNDQEAPAGA